MPSSVQLIAAPNSATSVIQAELIPESKTSPGPPTNPKPLMMLDIMAITTTNGPKLWPATRKSAIECVRPIAHTPTTKHAAR
ncbi:MAG: hypothetical protein R2748_14870 [Bryobacterales bacterium]